MTTATGNIVLTIGSRLGPGGFASLQAAIQMVGKLGRAVKDAILEGEKFAQVWRNTKVDISDADAATKGLIDTMALMTNANKLTEAGIKVTAREYEQLNKFVLQYARTTGQDATAAAERLTTAIVSGTTVSLKRMGIEIESTGTAAGNFAEVMDQLGPKVDDVTFEVETLGEAMFQLGNNWETMIGHLAQAGHEDLGLIGTIIKGISDTIGEFANNVETVNAAHRAIEAEAEIRSLNMEFYAAMSRNALAEAQMILDEIEKIRFRISSLPWARTLFKEGGVSTPAAPRAMKAVGKAFGPQKETARRAGGAERRGTTSETPSLPEFYAGAVDERIAAMEAAREANEDWEKAEAEAGEKALKLQQKELKELQKTAAYRLVMYENELYQNDRKQAWREQELLQREEDALYYEYFMERHISLQDQLLMEEQRYMIQSRNMWQSGLEGKFKQMQIFLGAISQLQALENEKNFNLFKGIRIAELTVSGIVAAMEAFKALAGIPIVGPVLGGIAAAAVTAATIAGIAAISNETYKGGGGAKSLPSPSMSAGGAGGGGYTGPTAGGAGGGGDRDREVTINIRMDDSAAAWGMMVDENDRADQRGERSFRVSA
jgi:hypothetical protein